MRISGNIPLHMVAHISFTFCAFDNYVIIRDLCTHTGTLESRHSDARTDRLISHFPFFRCAALHFPRFAHAHVRSVNVRAISTTRHAEGSSPAALRPKHAVINDVLVCDRACRYVACARVRPFTNIRRQCVRECFGVCVCVRVSHPIDHIDTRAVC